MIFGWCAVIFFFFFGLYGGWQMTKTLWPGLHDDANLYSTVVINRAAGHGNHFNVYSRAFIARDGNTEFVGHGQLYYPIAADFLQKPDYEFFLRLLHQSNLLAFVLSFIVLGWQARCSLGLRWLMSCLFGVAGAYGTMAVLHYLQGRPEHGIPFILLVFQLAVLLFKWPVLPVPLAGVQVGLVAAMSPLPGAILGFSSILVLALRTQGAMILISKCLQVLLMAVISWLAASALVYPGNVLELVSNSLEGGSLYLFHPHQMPMYWVTLNLAPGLGLLFGTALAVACVQVYCVGKEHGFLIQKVILCAAMLPLAYFVWKHGISWSSTNYCFLPFFPSVASWILAGIKFPHYQSALNGRTAYRIVATLVLAGMALPGIGCLRTMLLQPAILENGISFQTARAEIEEIKKTLAPSEVIMIRFTGGRSPVVFDGPPWTFRTRYFPFFTREKVMGVKGRYFLDLQFTHATPKEVPGFKLVKNRFQAVPAKFAGVKIKATTPGYGYALYERDEEALKILASDPNTSENYK